MSLMSKTVREMFASGDDKRDAGLTTPEDVERFDDIGYGADPVWQKLDVYRPKAASGETLPVILSIHGGGWVYGDKERYQFYCMSLAQRGFAVVNYTYRLAPEFKFPAQMEDTNLAAAWIMKNADRYGLDAGRIYAVGDSAGGHMLALYAAICTNPDYAKEYDFRVPEGFLLRAVGLNCGVYQLDVKQTQDFLTHRLMRDVLPEKMSDEALHRISPVYFVTETFPPTLLMTASGDFLKAQVPIMEEQLKAKGVPYESLMYGDDQEELGHVFHLDVKSDRAAQCNDAECEFFRRYAGVREG